MAHRRKPAWEWRAEDSNWPVPVHVRQEDHCGREAVGSRSLTGGAAHGQVLTLGSTELLALS